MLPISTLTSAAVFAAASQPSMSSDGSASAMPRACISASAWSNSLPRSSSDRMKLQVVLMTPRKPSTTTAGMVSRTRLNTGTPSITAPSKKKMRSTDSASASSSWYANATGPCWR